MQQANHTKIRQAGEATGKPLCGLLSSRKKVASSEQSPTTINSEKLAPELAKCYDEIDQIYDYIRGLAPLPMQLRKIKSIDFELLEREKRYQLIEAANSKLIASHNQQQRLVKQQPLPAIVSTSGDSSAQQRSTERPIKVRQREADDSDSEQLREPTSCGSGGEGKHQQTARGRVEGPLPIKVVATTCNERPNVKRVESFNLNPSSHMNSANRFDGNDTTRAVLSAGTHYSSQKPAYLISSAQRGQLFRLPRAHSTSTLNKSGANQSLAGTTERQLGDFKRNTTKNRPLAEDGNEGADMRVVNTRTLPPLRLSRVLELEQAQTASLGRPGAGSKQLNVTKSKPAMDRLSAQRISGQTDLVRNFVDESSSAASSSAASSSSSSSSSSSASSTSSSSTTTTASPSQLSDSPLPNQRDHLSTNRQNSSRTSTNDKSHKTSGESDSTKSDKIRSLDQSKRKSKSKKEVSGSGEDGFTASAKSVDKWGEKSHSDYENDTISLSSSDCNASKTSGSSGSLSDLLRPSPLANKKNRIRRSSSGTGTAGGEVNELQSSSSRQGTSITNPRTKPPSSAVAHTAAEHIYEQIPAHKNLIVQRLDIGVDSKPHSLPHNRQAIDSYNHPRLQQHHDRQRVPLQGDKGVGSLAKPYNYPIAFAPNVASVAKQHHQVTGYLSTVTGPSQMARANVHNSSSVQQRRMRPTQGTYPPIQIAASQPQPIQHQQRHSNSHRTSNQAQTRLLDQQRHGLSMNNLHLLPYLGRPVMSLYHATGPRHSQLQHSDTDNSRLERSSSSSKMNKIHRAPRLSPAQLIAQIQMPRAVSKRQHEFSQFTAPRTIANSNSSRRPVFVWRPENGGNMIQTNLHQDHQRRYKPMEQQLVAGNSRGEQRGMRRLTAIGIGIEEALEQGVRRQVAPQQVNGAPNRARAFEAPASSDCLANHSSPNSSNFTHRPTFAGHFEPPQLLKAPLIDDDEPVSSAGSSGDCAQVDTTSGSKLLAHQQAAAFIQARCLNSVSDLHSFSSASSDETSESPVHSSSESPDAISGHRRGCIASDRSGDQPDKQATKPKSKSKTNTNESDEGGGNFVSSRSFIKCYYGRDESSSQPAASSQVKRQEEQRQQVAGTDSTGDRAALEARAAPKSQAKKGSERLLGLIGMGSAHCKQSSGEKPQPSRSGKLVASGYDTSSSQQRRPLEGTVATSPIAAMFVAAHQMPNTSPAYRHPANQAPLAGEFLDTEGPILVRDKRIAALSPNLVRHYQHPIVQVTKVPNFAHKNRSDPKNCLQSPNPEQQQHQAQARRRSSKAAQQVDQRLSQAGSTETTHSTSSYEAAIKNSQNVSSNQTKVVEDTSETAARYPNRVALREIASASNKKPSSAANKLGTTKVQSASGPSGQSLIKVPKLSKQSHLLNRPLPKPPVSASQVHTGTSGSMSRRVAALVQLQALGKSQSALVGRQQMVGSGGVVGSAPNASSKRTKTLVSTNLDLGAGNELRSTRQSRQTESERPYSTADLSGSSSITGRPQNSTRPSKAKSPLTGSQKQAGASSLSSPLALSIASTHPSPTVTTCTSSGISSRLTAGTHLANSNSSSQRSVGSSNSKGDRQRVKSFSELHKQAKQAAAAAERLAPTTSDGASTGAGEALNDKLGVASFALMDDSETQPSSPDGNDEQAGEPDDEPRKTRIGNETELWTHSIRSAAKRSRQRKGDEEALSSNLKLFDERFSSNFMDASSNDSLLESINFSGTRNRKSQVAAGRQR